MWVDVVFNHTTEIDARGPTYSLRGLDEPTLPTRDGWLVHRDAVAATTSTCVPVAQDLVLWSLDRLADLGIDGFRFDLARCCARRHRLVTRSRSGRRRGVRWSPSRGTVGAHLLGRAGRAVAAWNDRFRDEIRGFLRGEPGPWVAMSQRVQGSPDLFRRRRTESVNFLTCHDGFTLHDLTTVLYQ